MSLSASAAGHPSRPGPDAAAPRRPLPLSRPRLEVLGLVCCTVSIYCGSYFFNDIVNDGSKTAIAALVVLLNIAVVAYFVYRIVVEVIRTTLDLEVIHRAEVLRLLESRFWPEVAYLPGARGQYGWERLRQNCCVAAVLRSSSDCNFPRLPYFPKVFRLFLLIPPSSPPAPPPPHVPAQVVPVGSRNSCSCGWSCS